MHGNPTIHLWVLAALVSPTFSQKSYLKASNPDFGDHFGTDVGLDGSTLVIGAPFESGNSSVVNGDQSNNQMPSAGAAYVFVRRSGGWVQEAYLKPLAPGAQDKFGYRVDVSGNTIVVGAPFEDSFSTGVNHNPHDDRAFAAGAAYIFERTGPVWSQVAYLKAHNTGPQDGFGYEVAAHGDLVAIGAPWEEGSANSVNGTSDDQSAARGAVYVYRRVGSTWAQEAYLKPSQGGMADGFGKSVAIDGERILVGATGDDGPADGTEDCGAAYLFEYQGGAWQETAVLRAELPGSGDQFGNSVDLHGGRMVIGASGEDSEGSGSTANPQDDSVEGAGAAYVFEWNGTAWVRSAFLKARDPQKKSAFGASVAVWEDLILVGAPHEEVSAVKEGAAYTFSKESGTWEPRLVLNSSYPDFWDAFGSRVALSEGSGALCVFGDDSAAAGVNGDPDDNSNEGTGAAWLYENLDHHCLAPETYCSRAPNSAGAGAAIGASGSVTMQANDLVLQVEAVPPGELGFFFAGEQQAFVPWGTAVRCVGGKLKRLPLVQTDLAGRAEFALDFNALPANLNFAPGDTWHFQFWHLGPGALVRVRIVERIEGDLLSVTE